eukprot:TRINITY_DN14687_c0_g1_i1.p1 TRINITY_DN14687_c0_g1~~TRINITY_DN14687_c0_g1_i1.p1  ORF type:complete len:393 (+),score=67.15 TRINITY_DN14687_c0_g1_i1:85-1263(+)
MCIVLSSTLVQVPLPCKIFSYGPVFESQLRRRITGRKLGRPAAKLKWRDYEEAVQRKDLARALSFLESLDLSNSDSTSTEIQGAVPSSPSPSSLWYDLAGVSRRMLLDACFSADDMILVSRTYDFLHSRGYLPNFGKYRNFIAEGPRHVTPEVLKTSTGLEASKFAPKKWGLSGISVPFFFISMAGISYLVNIGIDFRPKLAVMLGLTLLDSIFLGGSVLSQLLCTWPPYKRRVLVHEAGHILAAYLLGCPLRGIVLDPFQAMQFGVQGQAGTQFWDKTLASELLEGKLSTASFDRYSMVLFAGIAAEALVYGEAEGGENDENLFRGILSLLKPPWSISQMSNQARWAVQQSFILLKENKNALNAIFYALEETSSLGFIIGRIEDAMETNDC